MFYNGNTYRIKHATVAFQIAIRDYIRERIEANLDGLERFEAIEREATSLRVCQFQVKHLIADFPPEAVTMETKDFLLRQIHLAHVDPDREKAIEQRDARQWHEAKEKIQAGIRGGRGGEVPERGGTSEKPTKTRRPRVRAEVRRVRGGSKR